MSITNHLSNAFKKNATEILVAYDRRLRTMYTYANEEEWRAQTLHCRVTLCPNDGVLVTDDNRGRGLYLEAVDHDHWPDAVRAWEKSLH